MAARMGSDDWTARRDFLAADVELALTFVEVAQTHYRLEEWAHGDAARAKAMDACLQVARRLDEAEVEGQNVRELRARLGALEEGLARLDQNGRKAA